MLIRLQMLLYAFLCFSHAFISFHTLSYAFICFHTLSYAFIRFHTLSYAFISLLNAFKCFYMLIKAKLSQQEEMLHHCLTGLRKPVKRCSSSFWSLQSVAYLSNEMKRIMLTAKLMTWASSTTKEFETRQRLRKTHIPQWANLDKSATHPDGFILCIGSFLTIELLKNKNGHLHNVFFRLLLLG